MSSAPSAPLPPAQVDYGFARVRIELLLQRLHNRNAEEPLARKSTRRKCPVVRRCPMLSEKVRGRLDTAASCSPRRLRRPCRLFSGHGNLMRMSRWTPKQARARRDVHAIEKAPGRIVGPDCTVWARHIRRRRGGGGPGRPSAGFAIPAMVSSSRVALRLPCLRNFVNRLQEGREATT